MVTDATATRTPTGEAARTGPVGRLARMLLAASLAWLAYDLWVDRTFIFNEDPESGLLILTAFAVFATYYIARLAGLGRPVLALLAVAAGASAALAIWLHGVVWAPPLTWLVWGVDLGIVVVVAVAFLMAVAVGTPGCEVGVFREVARRLRRETSGDDVLFCLIGLHRLDAWEARQPWHRRGRTS